MQFLVGDLNGCCYFVVCVCGCLLEIGGRVFGFVYCWLVMHGEC